jgi:hypothetical protein
MDNAAGRNLDQERCGLAAVAVVGSIGRDPLGERLLELLDWQSDGGAERSRNSKSGDQRVARLGQFIGMEYADFGLWADASSGSSSTIILGGVGVQTPPTDMPKSGSANYAGAVGGIRVHEGNPLEFAGTVDLTASFARGDVAGNINGLAGGTPFNPIGLSGTINSNGFSGTATAGPAATGSSVGMSAGTTGTFSGRFYGPQAAEVAGTVKILESNNSGLAAAFGARKQ